MSDPADSAVRAIPERRPAARAGSVAAWLSAAGCLAFALALALRPIAHDDLFGHLRAGEWMLRHAAVPRVDVFSFTRFGARWVTHEWGFSLLSLGVYRMAGFTGLLGLTALLTVAILAALATRAKVMADPAPRLAATPDEAPRLAATPINAPRSAATPDKAPPRAATPNNAPPIEVPRINAPRFAATPTHAPPAHDWPILCGVLGLGLWAVSRELFLRAALAGELMLALVLLGLALHARSGRRGPLVGVIAVFLVWANLHSGVVFGLFALALYALEPIAGRLLVPRWPRLAPWFPRREVAPRLLALAAAVSASLANPNGMDALLYPWRLRKILFASGIEWELGHFASVSPLANPGFVLLVALLAAALLAPGGGRPLPSMADLAAVVAFLALALWVHRLVFDFVVVALPVLAARLLGGAPRGGSRRSRGRLVGWGIAIALALAGGEAWAARSGGLRLLDRSVPEGAARFLAAERIDGRLFNHQSFGGYLGWRLDEPVFWDGRNDVFASLVREVTTTPFAEVAARYGVDHLVIAESEYRDLFPELASGRWGLVFWDDDCAIYLRREPRFAPLLARLELRAFPPFGGRPGLAETARDPAAAAAARRELDQVLAAWSENQRALYFEGVLSLYQGDLPRARRELEKAARLGMNPQVEAALARLAEAGRR